MKQKSYKRLTLRGKTTVYIDWANVHGWEKSLKRDVDTAKLFEYLKLYEQINDTRFYFGTDENSKSKDFLEQVKQVGYTVITKPVKYILAAQIDDRQVYRRKCDFDMEVCIDVHRALKEGFSSFVFFTGDGDYEPLYKMLIGLHKQAIVVYTKGHLGKEIWDMKKGIFKVELKNLIAL